MATELPALLTALGLDAGTLRNTCTRTRMRICVVIWWSRSILPHMQCAVQVVAWTTPLRTNLLLNARCIRWQLHAGPDNVARITRMMDGDIVLLTTFLEVQYPGIQRDSGCVNHMCYKPTRAKQRTPRVIVAHDLLGPGCERAHVSSPKCVTAKCLCSVVRSKSLDTPTTHVDITAPSARHVALCYCTCFLPRNSPSDFVLYHYNGIPRSEGAPLQYSRGTAKTEAPRDFGTGTAMLQVLRTRWPRLEVDWSEPVSIS